MADKLSKFNIKGTLADVIDAEARASIAELTESVAGMASDVSSAVSAAEDAKTTAQSALTAAQAAQSTADEKLNTSDAWKCGQLSKTFNDITIPTGGTYDFVFDIPDGVTDAFVIYARSADMDRPLLPINIFRYGTEFHNHMYNAGSSISSATIQIQIIYMYK